MCGRVCVCVDPGMHGQHILHILQFIMQQLCRAKHAFNLLPNTRTYVTSYLPLVLPQLPSPSRIAFSVRFNTHLNANLYTKLST